MPKFLLAVKNELLHVNSILTPGFSLSASRLNNQLLGGLSHLLFREIG